MTRRIDCPWCPGERLDDPDHLKGVHPNLWEAARPSVDRCECGRRTYYPGRLCAPCRDVWVRLCRQVGRVRRVSGPPREKQGGAP